MFDAQDVEEDDEPLTLKEVLEDLAKILRWLYFDYQLNVKGSSYQKFKAYYLTEIIPYMMDRIEDKYADHVEGTKKDLSQQKD